MKYLLALLCLLAMPLRAATYYIDWTGGADANNGTATGTAWKRHPYMQGFTGSYTHAAGDHFIFKGGETWPASCFVMTIVGEGNSGAWDRYDSGDKTWFTGGSWTRPCFDGENANLTTRQSIIYQVNMDYLIINDLEMKRVKINADTFIQGMIVMLAPQHVHMTNLYLHHMTKDAGVTTDENIGMLSLNYSGAPSLVDMIIDSSTISNFEGLASGNGMGWAIRQMGQVSGCNIGFFPTHLLHTGQMVVGNRLHNTVPSYDPVTHKNVIYCALWDGAGTAITTTATVAGNYIYDILTNSSSGAEIIYLEPGFGGNDATMLCYNNVIWHPGEGNRPIEVDLEGGSGLLGTVYIHGNTLVQQDDDTQLCISFSDRGLALKFCSLRNNLFISNKSAPAHNLTADTLVEGNNTLISVATATSQNFTVVNEYALTASGAAALGLGATLGSPYNVDINGNPRTVPWDIGAYRFGVASTTWNVTTLNATTINVGQ